MEYEAKSARGVMNKYEEILGCYDPEYFALSVLAKIK
jgi:hypothetical protein